MVMAASLAVMPAQAQNEPVRITNRTALPAVELQLVRSGQAEWGPDLLRGRPLRPGAFLALRIGDGSGCAFDIRMVLQGGQELVRRDADLCAERSVEITGGPTAAPPSGALPRVLNGTR